MGVGCGHAGAGSGGAFANFSNASVQDAYMEPLPSFRDVPAADRQLLFSKKLQLSTFTFDFMDATRHVREKELKRQTLLELVDYVNTGQVRTLFDLWDERLVAAVETRRRGLTWPHRTGRWMWYECWWWLGLRWWHRLLKDRGRLHWPARND
jgi:hypothetical protein